ncbi:hypothetical protein K438DRAFT_1995067 [Mycena galopus ATCC 62051]|nr:hypothetical protein K438DRAFT_1995067 [Mycena galopus ATCC 62051]
MEDLRLKGWPRPALSDMRTGRVKGNEQCSGRLLHHCECLPLVVSGTGNDLGISMRRPTCPRPTTTITTASRQLDSHADPDSHPDHRCSNHHHTPLVVSDSGDSTHTPTPTRTTTADSHHCECAARRVGQQRIDSYPDPDSHHHRRLAPPRADVNHALNIPPSPTDRSGKVYGLQVKHPHG